MLPQEQACKGGPVGSGAGGCARTHLKHGRFFGGAGRGGQGYQGTATCVSVEEDGERKEDDERIAVL